MSAIGGSMVPLFIMPVFMQKIAIVSINYWAMKGFFDIFLNKLPLTNIIYEIIVLFGIGIFFLFLAIINFKTQLKKIF
jgi:ABC-type multidrug transport system permease subunit